MASKPVQPQLSPEEIDRVIELVRNGVPPTVAMTRIGRAKSTMSMREQRDPEFAARIATAEAEFHVYLLEQLREWEEKDPKTIMWRLARQFPEQWSDAVDEPDQDAAADQAVADRAAWEAAVGTVPGFAAAPAPKTAPATPPPESPPASPG